MGCKLIKVNGGIVTLILMAVLSLSLKHLMIRLGCMERYIIFDDKHIEILMKIFYHSPCTWKMFHGVTQSKLGINECNFVMQHVRGMCSW